LVNPWVCREFQQPVGGFLTTRLGFSTLYNGVEPKQGLVVTIPHSRSKYKNNTLGTPTGTSRIAGPTDFLLAPGKTGGVPLSPRLMERLLDGIHCRCSSRRRASFHASSDRGQDFRRSSYTGLTSASLKASATCTRQLHKGRVNVYDNAFQPVNLAKGRVDQNSSDHDNSSENSFVDEKLPNSNVPFNVQAIGNNIVVTYVLPRGRFGALKRRPGTWLVDIYSSTGQLCSVSSTVIG